MICTSTLIQRADRFVKDRHSSHYREGGEPFYNHLERVAERVQLYGGSEAAVTAALLHDSVEDHKAKKEEICKLFGNEVYMLVCILTRREDQTYDEYIDSIVASHNRDAILIKLSDNEDNIASCGDAAFPPDKEARLKARWLKSKHKMEAVLNG